MEKIAKRNSGIELLRIVSTLMICCNHILVHGRVINSSNSYNYWMVWMIESFFVCSVDVFGLISGYVNIKKKIDLFKLTELWLIGLFYSFVPVVSRNIIGFFVNNTSINYVEILRSLLPIKYGGWWYFKSYFIMILFTPFINNSIDNIDKKESKYMLIIFIVLLSLISVKTELYFVEGFSALWLFVLYVLGKLISVTNVLNKLSGRLLLLLYIISSFGTLILNKKMNIVEFGYNTSPTVLFSAIFLLLFFSRLNYVNDKVNYISSLTFGTYLFHDNYNIRDLLIVNRFAFLQNTNFLFLPFIVLTITFCVFGLSCIVETIRKYIYRKLHINDYVFKIVCFFDHIINVIVLHI